MSWEILLYVATTLLGYWLRHRGLPLPGITIDPLAKQQEPDLEGLLLKKLRERLAKRRKDIEAEARQLVDGLFQEKV